MIPCTIRIASKNDTELLTELGIRTFSETYAEYHPKKDMDAYLAEAFDKTKISENLHDKNTVFLLADFKDKTVGYAKLTNRKSPPSIKDQSAIELERLYIVEDMIGKGIGAELMRESIKAAKNKGYKTMWLAVWEFNLKAQSFYKKFSFENFGEDIFVLGKTKRNLVLMKRKIE